MTEQKLALVHSLAGHRVHTAVSDKWRTRIITESLARLLRSIWAGRSWGFKEGADWGFAVQHCREIRDPDTKRRAADLLVAFGKFHSKRMK